MLNDAQAEYVSILVSSTQVVKKPLLLEADARALSYEEEVEEALCDHGAFALLDDIREHRESRRETCIAVRENIDIGALRPFDVERRVNGRLDVLTIEIHWRTIGLGPSKGQLGKVEHDMERAYGGNKMSDSIGNCENASGTVVVDNNHSSTLTVSNI